MIMDACGEGNFEGDRGADTSRAGVGWCHMASIGKFK